MPFTYTTFFLLKYNSEISYFLRDFLIKCLGGFEAYIKDSPPSFLSLASQAKCTFSLHLTKRINVYSVHKIWMLPENPMKLPALGSIKKQPIQFPTMFLHFDYFMQLSVLWCEM